MHHLDSSRWPWFPWLIINHNSHHTPATPNADCYRPDQAALALPPPSASPIQGMDFTTDKMRSMVRKWQSLIEAHVDVKTADGYYLRMFCIAFTKKRQGQIKKTCYAQSSQVC